MHTKKTRKCLIRHTKKRAAYRYNLALTNDDINMISMRIQQGLSLFSERISRIRSLHIIQYNDKYIRVVYDSSKNAPATFLPIYNNREKSNDTRNSVSTHTIPVAHHGN